MLNKNRIIELIVTFFYIGKIKYCPGTFGSLAAFPLCYLILYVTTFNTVIFPSLSNYQLLITTFFIFLFIVLLLIVLGIYCTSVYIKIVSRNDPKEVVIDEVAGQMLVIVLCSFSVIFASYSGLHDHLSSSTIDFILLFVMPFVLFRLFDITKPWPINWVDRNIKGGLGVMLDDILAAIFATVVHYAIIFKLIDWYTP